MPEWVGLVQNLCIFTIVACTAVICIRCAVARREDDRNNVTRIY